MCGGSLTVKRKRLIDLQLLALGIYSNILCLLPPTDESTVRERHAQGSRCQSEPPKARWLEACIAGACRARAWCPFLAHRAHPRTGSNLIGWRFLAWSNCQSMYPIKGKSLFIYLIPSTGTSSGRDRIFPCLAYRIHVCPFLAQCQRALKRSRKKVQNLRLRDSFSRLLLLLLWWVSLLEVVDWILYHPELVTYSARWKHRLGRGGDGGIDLLCDGEEMLGWKWFHYSRFHWCGVVG